MGGMAGENQAQEGDGEGNSLCHQIINLFLNQAAQNGPPQLCTHSVTGGEPSRPTATSYNFSRIRGQTCPSPEETSDIILADSGSSSYHFGPTQHHWVQNWGAPR